MLKAIGFWIESLEDETQPAPQELVGMMPKKQRAQLANYLAAGMPVNFYLGYSWCRFGCGIDGWRLGSRDLTDGTWVWPEGLAHYVRQHGVLLPLEFIDHALTKRTPREPGGPDDDHDGSSGIKPSEPVDKQSWNNWCATQRSPETVDRLALIRNEGITRAQAESAAKYKAAIAKLIQERGVSDTNCIWRDCLHRSLTDSYMCAEHSVDGWAPHVSTHSVLYEFLTELSRAHGVEANFEPREPSYSTRLRTAVRRLLLGKGRSMFKVYKRRR